MASSNLIEQAFTDAQRSFRAKLRDPDVYNQLLATRDVDEVYKTTLKLQEEANGKGRNLAKITSFLDRLSKYAGVIETMISAKPEILALIWGPLKLLLQWSSQMTTALDKFTTTLVEIGRALPHVEVMGGIFQSDAIKNALALLYEDILDFYRVNFDFFRKKRWKQLLDTLWDSHLTKLNIVVDNLKQHSSLLREEVTLLDIAEARKHRIKSLEDFDIVHNYQQRQKFFGLRGRISVNLYDDRLDWIRNRSVPGCEKWLLDDPAFCKWKDNSTKGSQTEAWLWLQGIPGAGKTYLCGATIDHLKQQGEKLLFAFLSYNNNATQTALTVLQSFIFQAAEDDADLQSILVDATERELRGNTGYVLDLLKTWLQTAGPTYIIIDGLDEMDRSERQILLQRLEELSKKCHDLRLFTCSRSEADISRVLDEKTTSIQVNSRNSGSIQIYINSRINDWINKFKFDTKIEHELRLLLSPLSAKADGMFLFARIILDDVDEIRSIDEIRRELKAMPNDLNGAYQRIFQRINEMDSRRREERRKILGWVGCAPTPMTIFEMEQALLVNPDPDRSIHVPSSIVKQYFLEMCGPFVEIVDGKLQFVHFTVREYIFSKDIPNFIDEREATRDLTAAFLAYLASDIMDPDLDDDQISGDIMCGKYRLLQYAHFYFPTLLQRMNNIRPNSYLVGKLLDRLARQYSNDEFQATGDSRDPPYINQHYEKHRPEGYECARQTFQFHLAERRWGWNRNNSGAWVNFDPLSTSKMLLRIQKLYEGLIRDSSVSRDMESHYGPRLFKCTYLFCTFSRQGFETKEDRDKHVTHHERPCKCPVPNCIYYTLGFNTQGRCNEHLAQFHAPKFNTADLAHLDAEDIQPLLFTSTIDGDLENVRRLIASPGGKNLKPEVLTSARLIAAEKGSLGITKLLAPPDEVDVPQEIVKAAVKSQDAECAQWAISNAGPSYDHKLMMVMLDTKSEQIYRMWEESIIDNIRKNPERRSKTTTISYKRLPASSLIDKIFRAPVFSDINGSVLKETRLQHTLEVLREHLEPFMLGTILVRLASSSCTLSIAKQLLSYGAPMDHPWRTYTWDRISISAGSGMTALQRAAKKTTQDAALLMQLLVLRGAETDWRGIEDKPGAKKIGEFIGVEWADLLRQAPPKIPLYSRGIQLVHYMDD
ncbi:NACHT domain protein [Aspergillus parasiticus]|uniref:NACHT domain protein n=1 Tax=Aspergillus parasiticus TaxID=5067 RepID=A0A5N6E0S9_ASPPA|nr:NACHT domain protein [Aspergillus parasiticus]